MAFVKVMVPRSSQPQDAVGVDSSSFLLAGNGGGLPPQLLALICGTWNHDVVTKTPLTVYGSASTLVHQKGKLLSTYTSGDVATKHSVDSGGSSITMFWYGHVDPLSSRYDYVCGDSAIAISSNHSGIGNRAGFYLASLIDSGVTLTSGYHSIVLCRTLGNNVTAYIDGVLVASSSLSATSGQSNFAVGSYGANQSGNRANCGTLLSGKIRFSAWSAAQARAFHDNPWQIFEPEEQWIWIPDSAGSSGATYTLPADSAAITLEGQTATLTHTVSSTAYSLAADTVAITVAAQAAALQTAYKLPAATAAITLAAQDATLTHTTAGSTAYSIAADSVAITLAAQDAVLRGSFVMPAASGDMSIAGQDAALQTSRRLAAESVAITLAGQAATLTHTTAGVLYWPTPDEVKYGVVFGPASEYTGTLTGTTGPTAADIAAAVIAGLQSTAIPVNMVQVKGQVIDGAGTEENPWGPGG